MVKQATGYESSDDRMLSELTAQILVTALSQTMPASALKGIDRYVSDSNKAYCYQLIHEWQHGNSQSDLEEICRVVERELRLSDRFDKTEIGVLLKSDTFPAINESVLKHFFTEISENVVKVEDILTAVKNRRTAAWYELTEEHIESLYYIAK